MKMGTFGKFGNQEGRSSKLRFNFFKVDASCLGSCTTMQRECTCTVYNFRDATNPIRPNAILSRADSNNAAVAAGTGISGEEPVIQTKTVHTCSKHPFVEKMQPSIQALHTGPITDN
jgi:hypothetical protein